MTDLGTLPGGGSYTPALGINSSGQVVGHCILANGDYHAFLWSGGTMIDLNSLVTLPGGAHLETAYGINDLGQVAANGSDGHAYLLTLGNLTLGNSLLTVLNPFALYACGHQAPPTLDVPTVLRSPPATSLAADGASAVVLVYRSRSPEPVTFTLSTPLDSPQPAKPVGSLGQFNADYLKTPPSSPGGNFPSYTSSMPTGPDAGGNYVFLALLWSPNALPVTGLVEHLAVTATQQGQSAAAQLFISLKPPPLLLVHGIWSSAAEAWFISGSQEGFYDWIVPLYPHNLIYAIDYGITENDGTKLNAQSFSDPRIQAILLQGMADELAAAAATGMAVRTVDVVAHSMGGLVTRYFMSNGPPSLTTDLLSSPVHLLITIGTPHLGSNLAQTLDQNKDLDPAFRSPLATWVCGIPNPCTLGDYMADQGMPVGAGTQSLEPNSALSTPNQFWAIVGDATGPLPRPSELLLDAVIKSFLPGGTVANILKEDNDTIVGISSQAPSGAVGKATIDGIVHKSLCGACDTEETRSHDVWEEVNYWLTGGASTGSSASLVSSAAKPSTTASTMPQPVLDLSGYTQVAASNVVFLPATGSILTVNSATNITATSSAKTITEVLLLQTVTDPTDTVLLYATQSPFTIPFTPTRLGSTSFGAIAVFSDNTYAMATLTYTFQSGDTPYALNLVNAPVASMNVGDSRVVQANALSPSGQINVTQVATYTARSGSTSVFSVSAGGTITANGNGMDFLDVSYGGVTATAQIPVGAWLKRLLRNKSAMFPCNSRIKRQLRRSCPSKGFDLPILKYPGDGSTTNISAPASQNPPGTHHE